MFIEKLTDEEIIAFFKKSLANFQPEINQRVTVNRYSGSSAAMFGAFENGVDKIITINDYYVSISNVIADTEILKYEWQNFMCEKFGDEYKQAFNGNLNKKYEEEMIK